MVDTDHAYRCFCTPERLQRVREARQKQGNYIAYDKHCSYLSEEEIQANLEKKIPFTIRLRVCKTLHSILIIILSAFIRPPMKG